jgi:hypothetical protein
LNKVYFKYTNLIENSQILNNITKNDNYSSLHYIGCIAKTGPRMLNEHQLIINARGSQSQWNSFFFSQTFFLKNLVFRAIFSEIPTNLRQRFLQGFLARIYGATHKSSYIWAAHSTLRALRRAISA